MLMESRPRPDEAAAEPGVDDGPQVTAHESRPGRVVFTEADNCDAWIASDLTVDPGP